ITGIVKSYLITKINVKERTIMSQLEVYNPSTNEIIERLNYTSHDEIHSQIERARTAFEEWKLVDAHERSAKLYQWGKLIDEHQNELISILQMLYVHVQFVNGFH